MSRDLILDIICPSYIFIGGAILFGGLMWKRKKNYWTRKKMKIFFLICFQPIIIVLGIYGGIDPGHDIFSLLLRTVAIIFIGNLFGYLVGTIWAWNLWTIPRYRKFFGIQN
jgi:hypothetical protein